jgi:eukaryotic-like serine/threonine-protein kinase
VEADADIVRSPVGWPPPVKHRKACWFPAARLAPAPTWPLLLRPQAALYVPQRAEVDDSLANDLGRRFPEDTTVRFNHLPTLRGLFALNHGDPAKAIDLLKTAVPYDLAQTGIGFFGFFGNLYPAYMRGEAYLAADQVAEAIPEFQKILDHRGIVLADPLGALAHLQLGRAFALSGDKVKAKAAYQDFLTIWKDADPGIPIFKQAKAE